MWSSSWAAASSWRSAPAMSRPRRTSTLATPITTSAASNRARTSAVNLIRSGVRGRWGRMRLGGWEPENVADPAVGVDQVRLDSVDLAAQHGDVVLHDSRVALEVEVPDRVEDLLPGQHAVRVGHQVTQQPEFGR